MLVDHADVQCVGVVGIADLHTFPVHVDFAPLWLVQTEQHAHQGGFPRAVFPQQGVDLAPPELERDVVVGHDAWEDLGDVQHFHYIVFRGARGKIPPCVRLEMCYNIL